MNIEQARLYLKQTSRQAYDELTLGPDADKVSMRSGIDSAEIKTSAGNVFRKFEVLKYSGGPEFVVVEHLVDFGEVWVHTGTDLGLICVKPI